MEANSRISDRLKELTYHETAHASHFVKAGPQFWIDLVQTEENGILYHGGNPYHQAGGIVDIAEAWAYHVGWLFADKHYAIDRSKDWTYYLEKYRNIEDGHIPCGVFQDMKDEVPNGIENTYDYCCGGSYPVNDRVQGFNCSQMFGTLGPNINSPNSFYQNFKSKFGNNDPLLLQKMNELFNSY
ncbi:MAG TPA: hypothetical protein PKD32_10795 [Saprospiraceae bacterium]|nr:hypothetical protein [Saprospiraceae bacterium]